MKIVLLCTSLSLLTATSALAQFAKPLPPVGNDKKAADAPKAAGAGDNAAAPSAAANKLFAAFDLDGDGVISKTELRKAIVSLKKLDTNNDGEISMAECGISADSNGQPVADANAGANPNGAANDPNANAAGVNGVGGTAFNGRGNEAMGVFLQLDKNHDGKLSLEEVPQHMRGYLLHADLNGDGFIQPDEFAAAAKKAGDRMKAGYAAGMNGGATNNGRRP